MKHIRRSIPLLTLGLAVGGALAVAAPAAQAYSTETLPIDCSGVWIHSTHSATSTRVGEGFRGDKDLISKVYYLSSPPNMKDSWLYGTVTRKSDGRRITGWVTSQCIDFYG